MRQELRHRDNQYISKNIVTTAGYFNDGKNICAVTAEICKSYILLKEKEMTKINKVCTNNM